MRDDDNDDNDDNYDNDEKSPYPLQGLGWKIHVRDDGESKASSKDICTAALLLLLHLLILLV